MDILWIGSIIIAVLVTWGIVSEKKHREMVRLMKKQAIDEKASGKRAVSYLRKELKECISDLKETLREYEDNPSLWSVPREEGGRISNIEEVKDKLECCEEWEKVLKHRLKMEVEEIELLMGTMYNEESHRPYELTEIEEDEEIV